MMEFLGQKETVGQKESLAKVLKGREETLERLV
jgi:hypothetical protein